VKGFRRILAAIEFLPSGRRVLEAACGAADAGASLRLLHVVEWVPSVVEGAMAGYGSARSLRDLHADSERQLQSYAQQCRGLAGVEVSTEVVEGALAGTVLDVAEEWKADLVVIGASRGGGIASFHPGGAVDRLLRSAKCPVLVVPS
jgi:nucleotide-binding universal stress UspA family protein